MVYSVVAEEIIVYYLYLPNCIVLDERWEVVLSKVMPNPTKSPLFDQISQQEVVETPKLHQFLQRN
jgi:hypothetical protein